MTNLSKGEWYHTHMILIHCKFDNILGIPVDLICFPGCSPAWCWCHYDNWLEAVVNINQPGICKLQTEFWWLSESVGRCLADREGLHESWCSEIRVNTDSTHWNLFESWRDWGEMLDVLLYCESVWGSEWGRAEARSEAVLSVSVSVSEEWVSGEAATVHVYSAAVRSHCTELSTWEKWGHRRDFPKLSCDKNINNPHSQPVIQRPGSVWCIVM